MPRKREVSWDPALFPALFEQRHGQVDRNKSPLAALMETPPNHVPEPTQEELLPLREVLQDALETILDEREQFVFNSLVVERQSLRAVGRMLSLSKTQVGRIKYEAARKLRKELENHPLVKEHLR